LVLGIVHVENNSLIAKSKWQGSRITRLMVAVLLSRMSKQNKNIRWEVTTTTKRTNTQQQQQKQEQLLTQHRRLALGVSCEAQSCEQGGVICCDDLLLAAVDGERDDGSHDSGRTPNRTSHD